MIRKIKPDREKALCLANTAKVTFQRLNELDKIKYPGNSLIDYYDIIHGFMEALAALGGIKTRGEGAHQELIDYVCKTYKFNESDRIFLQELRDYRNRISYEGFSVTIDYIKLNSTKIEEIIKMLIKLGEERGIK